MIVRRLRKDLIVDQLVILICMPGGKRYGAIWACIQYAGFGLLQEAPLLVSFNNLYLSMDLLSTQASELLTVDRAPFSPFSLGIVFSFVNNFPLERTLLDGSHIGIHFSAQTSCTLRVLMVNLNTL